MYLAGSILLIYCFLAIVGHPHLRRPPRLARPPHPGGRLTAVNVPERTLPTAPDLPDAGVAPTAAEDRVSLASNWTLVWWRFRKHRLAMASAVVLLGLYAVVLCPDFFSTQDPEATEARLAFIPVQRPHCWTGSAGAPGCRRSSGSAIPTTLRMEWQVDPAGRSACGFFVRGYPYRVLGLFPASRHLLGTADEKPADRIYLLGTDRLGRDQWSRLMHGTQTSMTIGLVAVTLSVVLGVVLGGVSGYFGGLARPGHPAVIELLQSLPTIPHLARAHRRAAARLDADPGLLRDHRHPLPGGLDHPRPRGARTVPGAPGGGLRPGGRPGGLHAGAHHPSAHGAHVPEPHHRHQHAGHPGDDHQRDLAQLPRARDPASRDQLGRAPAGGAEHPDAGARAVAPDPGPRW